jgi:ribosome-associated heat shock protein Hsp15
LSTPLRTIRLDKWLWHARFFKTRSLSAKRITGGHVQVNSVKVAKTAALVGPGDTLTFAQGRDIKVIRILEIGVRRGPAPEAQALYQDLSPPVVRDANSDAGVSQEMRKGRPTKQDRQAILKFKDGLKPF